MPNMTDKNSLSGLKNIFPHLSQVVTAGYNIGSMSTIGIPNIISSTGSNGITQKPEIEFKNLASPVLQQQQENTQTQVTILSKAGGSIDDIKLKESNPDSKNSAGQQWKVNPFLNQTIISKFGGGNEDKNQENKTDQKSYAVKPNAYQDQNFVDKIEGGTKYKLQENKSDENQGMNKIISASGSFDLEF